MFDASIRYAPRMGAFSQLRRVFSLFPTRPPRGRRSQELPASAWLRRDVGLPRECDGRPAPYLYR